MNSPLVAARPASRTLSTAAGRPSFEDAKRQYVHRFTMEHIPAWAKNPLNPVHPGKYPAPQFKTDQEWYDHAKFKGESGWLGKGTDAYTTGQTWPLGQMLDEPYQKGQTKASAKVQLLQRVQTARPVAPGDIVDRTTPLRELLQMCETELGAITTRADEAGFELHFDYDGRHKAGAVLASDRETMARFSLATDTHTKWNALDLAKITKSPLLRPLFDRMLALSDAKTIRTNLIVANAISKILKIAKEATFSAVGHTAALPQEVEEQVSRILDSIELQLGLEIDRLERRADAAGPKNSANGGMGADENDPVIQCLDTILRGEGAERMAAVAEYFDNDYSEKMSSAAVIRNLDAVARLLKNAPPESAAVLALAVESFGQIYENEEVSPGLKRWFSNIRRDNKLGTTDKVRMLLNSSPHARQEDMLNFVLQDKTFLKAVGGKAKRYGTQFLSEAGSKVVARFIVGTNALVIFDTSVDVKV